MINSYRKDILINVAGNLMPLLVAYFTVPKLLNSLSAEAFGVVTLMWALIGYFGVFDLGIGRALTYEIRLAITSEREEDVSPTIKSGVLIAILTGGAGACVIGFLVAPNATNWFGIPQEKIYIERVFQIVAITIIPTTFFSCMRGGLEAFGRFSESNFSRSIIGCFMFLIPYLEVELGSGDLINIALGIAVMRLAVLMLAIYWLRMYFFSIQKIQFTYIKRLLTFGVWITVSSIVSPIMVYGDRFLVSGIVGAGDLLYYAIPQEGIQRLLIIPGAVTAALLPRLIGQLSLETINSMYSDSKNKIAIIMLSVCVVCSFAAHKVMEVWLNIEFADKAILVVFVLLIGIWFNSLAQFPVSLLHAKGRPLVVACIHIVELLIYILMIYVLTSIYGIIGAALAWTARAAVDYFILDYCARLEINRQ